MDLNSEFILEWNSEFPLDRWWRSKYKVPFNSVNHRSISPKDMLLDFIEDEFYRKVSDSLQEEKLEENKYIPGAAQFLKEQILSEADFEEIDLSNFNLK